MSIIGIALFITEPPSPWLTGVQRSPVVVREVFGVCDDRETHTPPSKIGPGLIYAAFAMGHAPSHAHMAMALAAMGEAHTTPSCTVHQVRVHVET